MRSTDEPALRAARVMALLSLVLVLPLAAFPGTARSIVATWSTSQSFAHGYFIPPIALWLIWRRRHLLAAADVAPWWPGLTLLLACSALWFAADVADAQVGRQYALAAALPATAATVLGTAAVRVLAFPLAFLMLAVPFGDAFIDPLIELTAAFTVNALLATGIPVLREGSQFTIPSGRWSVVEACSGVRYLIASFTLGCLFAYLNYRSLSRRLAFIVLSILVPIAANAVRAYLIVLLGHLSDNRRAAGIDHLIYGWLFFGLVMFLLFWIGGRWQEASGTRLPDIPAGRSPGPLSAWCGPALALAIATVALPVLALENVLRQPHRGKANLDPLVLAWSTSPSFTDWQPAYRGANAELHRTYAHARQEAALSILYYRNQRQEGAELISSVNRLAAPRSRWSQVSQQMRVEQLASREIGVRESVISDGRQVLLVWSWYWIGGRSTASDYAGKFYQAAQRLAERRDDSAALIAYARLDDDPARAQAALRAFLDANLARIETALAVNLNDRG